MTCTLVVVNDGQKDPKLLSYFFKALTANDLTDVQVLLLQQAADGEYARKLAAAQPFDIEVCESTGEIVDGIRLWDLLADLKAMRPKMTGDYLLLAHKEFIAEPGYFAKSLAWLDDNEPNLAMTNLMRLGDPDEIDRRTVSSSKRESVKIKQAVTAGRTFPDIKCLPWIYHREPEPGEWVEDAFFAKLSWLDDIRFFEHSDRQLFQDVYDLIGGIVKITGEPAARIPEGRLYHLWHRKDYCHFTDSVVGYFASDPDRWAGTCMSDKILMRQIQYYLQNRNGHRKNPVADFRRNDRGTVTRYMAAFKAWWNSEHPKDIPEAQPRASLDGIEKVLIISPNRSWRDPSHPLRVIASGTEAMAMQTHVIAPGRWPVTSVQPDVVIAWNGRKGKAGELVKRYQEKGVKTFIMERGFFDRMNYSQADLQGFNHTASWACQLGGPAPVEGVRRFAAIEASIGKRTPVKAHKSGYILVLGQTNGDAQLRDSGIHRACDLFGAVRAATGEKIVFRPHPENGWRPEYAEVMDGPLGDVLSGARFCITINSNAGNDALWAGVPVLCFGPSLYEMAGVAMGTAAPKLEHDIRLMLNGWAPNDRRVLSYMHWLCARQWTNKELATGAPLRQILSEGIQNDN